MNLSLPTFCEFYKFYIVEEIALERNIDKVHYGKCNIIGYLSSSDCLQSLTIPNVEKYEKFKKYFWGALDGVVGGDIMGVFILCGSCINYGIRKHFKKF